MSTRRFQLSRRAVLRGLGATIALPTLEAMLDSHGTALAQGQALPKRFATFFWGNGVILPRWRPTATGENWQPSEALVPLAGIKDYVNVITGYNVKTPNRRGHHTGVAAAFSGFPFIELPANGAPYASKFGGPSIDQVAASTIGKDSTFPSLELAVSKRVTRGEGPTLQYISHKGPDTPVAPTFNPSQVFTRLFGTGGTTPTNDPKADLRANVLDAVRDDARRLQAKLGSADKARLDQHLTSISELRRQILATAPITCSPTPVSATNADVSGREQMELTSKAMSDLLVMAWSCDVNRVASFQFSGSVAGTVYSEIGHTENQHTLTHDGGRQGDVHDSVVFVMKNFAYLLTKLRDTPDGGTNLLDSACIFASSDLAEGLPHSINDYPLLVAGRARGALKSKGVHIRGSGQNVSDVLLSCLQAVGTGVTSVGGDSGLSSTPCAALMA